MSKASDWREGERLLSCTFQPNHPLQSGLALVERGGALYVELRHKGIALVGASLAPAEACGLAHWILDTYEEAPNGHQ